MPASASTTSRLRRSASSINSSPADLGVKPLRLDPTFYCRACGTLASSKSCPHGPAERLELSGTKVREILRSGGRLPEEFTRPEVAEVLRAHYLKASGEAPRRRQQRRTG